jgi:hypothetical protein
MIAVVRTGVLAGMVLCASLVAAPAFAAETPVVPGAPATAPTPAMTAPVPADPAPAAPATTPPTPAALPTAVAPATNAALAFSTTRLSVAVPTTLASFKAAPAPIAAPPAPQSAAIAVAAPVPAPVSLAAPASLAAKPAPSASLRDLVISFIDRRDQDAEQQCLAHAVFFEARGETLEGQLAVAQVVLNRAASGTFPASICQVVTQPAQFSFVRRGRMPEPDRSSECWHKALAIADIARKRAAAGEVASNVLWYHATYVSPRWGRQKTRFAQIGSHIFYS